MQYLKAIWDEHKYLGNWVPTRALKVGDVGTWSRDAGFSKVTTLREKNLGFKTSTSALGGGTISSNAGYSISPSGDVDLAGLGQGTFELEFAQKGSFVLHAEGCQSATIEGADLVFRRLKSQLRDGLWEEDYIVVTEVVTATAATILVSTDRDISAKVTGLKDANDLVSVNLAFEGNSAHLNQFVTRDGLTLMFKGFRVDKTWYGAVRSRPVTFGLENDDVGGAPKFVEATY